MIRLAVIKYGDEWCVQAENRRLGHFPQMDAAFRAGVRLAREAIFDGEDVELLVQDFSGRLERFAPYASCETAPQGSTGPEELKALDVTVACA
jgi:hypothetical protein